LPVLDVASAADPLAAALDAALADVRAPFELDHGPLMRGMLHRLGDDDHLLVVVAHHIAIDGWSRGLLRNELSSLHAAFSTQQPSPLPEVEFGYPVWAAAQRRQLESGALNGALEYWRKRLDPFPPPVLLATDRPRRPQRDPHGATVSLSVDGSLRAALMDVARSQDATLFMTLLSAFVAVLWRHTGLDDIVVGIPVAGRLDARSENVIGPFLNTLPIRVAVDGEASFVVLLDRIRNACLEAYDHQQIPLERMVDEAEVPRAVDHAPLIQVLFQIRNLPSFSQHVGSLTAEDVAIHTAAAKFDLSVDIDDRGDRLDVRFEYPTALFDSATIERLGRHLVNLLGSASHDPDVSLETVDQLDDAERAVLFEFSTEGKSADAGWTVADRVAAVAASRPSCIAVRSAEGSMSYEELLAGADALARRLTQHGAVDHSFVGVCLPRTLDLPMALLAVLRAGAAVVPLDPSLPPARLRAIIEQANVETVLTVDQLAVALPRTTRILRLDDGQEPSAAELSAVLSVIDPESVAYAIATSGSTGTPKCVLIQHGSLANFLTGFATRLGLGDSIRMLASTPISFDPFVRELLLPLVLGGEVVLTRDAIAADPLGVAAYVREHDPSVVQGTPTTLRVLLDAGWAPGASVIVLSCGERLDEATAERLKVTAGRVWNLYGPTETTQCAVVHELGESLDRIPVGRPLPGVIVEVVGPDLEPIPIGLPGEILIGGSGVALGYAGTTSAPDPFVTLARGRRYRTGDVGRWRNDGRLDCLGRNDDQLKVNGVRIEPGDAEAALTTHPSVRAAVVRVRDGRLVAWVSLIEPVGEAELRRHVADLLPTAMLPSAVVMLDEFPTLPNGKIDRNALVAPGIAPKGSGGAPQGEMEARLAQLWASVLDHRAPIGRDDDFFEIGGDSLLAIQVTMAIEQRFGRRLPFTQFFETPDAREDDHGGRARAAGG
jgi:amino acid adenylation domain-containing protein